MPGKQETGRTGEALAAFYLESMGYRILERNRRFGRLEVDLIASRGEMLHFIEVKTRNNRSGRLPEENVSTEKIERILDAAEIYLNENQSFSRIQLDILSITLRPGAAAEFFLIEDVYL